jgi:UDPglucose 6-dehydrogenase
MRGVIDINEQQYERMVDKIVRASGRGHEGNLDGVLIGVLGLTFKAGTDDLRESPSLRVIEGLRQRGAVVQAYDPTVTGELTAVQEARLAEIELRATAMDAALGADVLVVLTEWPEFATIDLAKVVDVMKGGTVVDCRNLLDSAHVRNAGLEYEGVGRT